MAKLPPPPRVGPGSDDADSPVEALEVVTPDDGAEAWLGELEVAAPPEPLRRAAPVTPTTPAAKPSSSPAATPDNRRTVITVAGVLGAALVAVLIARCGSDDATATRTSPTIAGARVDAPAIAPAPDPEPEPAEARPSEPAPAAAAPTAAAPTAAAPEPAAPAAAAPIDDDEPTVEPSADVQPTDAATPANTVKSTAQPSSRRTDTASTSGTTSADAGMTAAESLERARAAWKAGNAKDTYKYANKSRFKEDSAEATELATLAACKMKLDDAAKSSFKQLSGDRKKRTRAACRDFGVRVGL